MARFDISTRQARMYRVFSLFEKLADKAVKDYLNGDISLLDFHLLLQQYIKRENAMMVFAGTGAETPADVLPREWLVLGNEIKKQFKYLSEFMTELENGLVLSQGKLVDRVGLYIQSAGSSFWRSVSPVDLPAYPQDGSTQCLGNCKCEWVFEDVKDVSGKIVAILAYWTMGVAEHCPDCVERSTSWNPIRVSV